MSAYQGNLHDTVDYAEVGVAEADMSYVGEEAISAAHTRKH